MSENIPVTMPRAEMFDGVGAAEPVLVDDPKTLRSGMGISKENGTLPNLAPMGLS